MSNTNDDLVEAMALALACSDRIADAFQGPWEGDPNVLAVLGVWMNRAKLHVEAITRLASSGDLAELGELHYRQLLEIWFQVRLITMTKGEDRARFAHKAVAWGLFDWLEKMGPLRDEPNVELGYLELSPELDKFDGEVVQEVERQRAKRRFYWFGGSFSSLARKVQREGERLDELYAFASARAHGTWALYLNVTQLEPDPGR